MTNLKRLKLLYLPLPLRILSVSSPYTFVSLTFRLSKKIITQTNTSSFFQPVKFRVSHSFYGEGA